MESWSVCSELAYLTVVRPEQPDFAPPEVKFEERKVSNSPDWGEDYEDNGPQGDK